MGLLDIPCSFSHHSAHLLKCVRISNLINQYTFLNVNNAFTLTDLEQTFFLCRHCFVSAATNFHNNFYLNSVT